MGRLHRPQIGIQSQDKTFKLQRNAYKHGQVVQSQTDMYNEKTADLHDSAGQPNEYQSESTIEPSMSFVTSKKVRPVNSAPCKTMLKKRIGGGGVNKFEGEAYGGVETHL